MKGDRMTRQEAIEEVKKLAEAPSVCAEAKQAAETYLSAVGTETEKKTAAELIAELEEDVTSVDDLIELTESAEGVKIFGEDQAHSLNQAAREAKANGGVYCVCPACQAGGALLDHRDALLG